MTLSNAIKTLKEEIRQCTNNPSRKVETNDQISESNMQSKASKASPSAEDPLLEFLAAQIRQKEVDLECPVCLETAQSPIYTCSEQHIVCSGCWQQVIRSRKDCVQCRTPYPKAGLFIFLPLNFKR